MNISLQQSVRGVLIAAVDINCLSHARADELKDVPPNAVDYIGR